MLKILSLLPKRTLLPANWLSSPIAAEIKQKQRLFTVDMSRTKRKWQKPQGSARGLKRKQKKQNKPIQEGSHEEVLMADIQALLAATKISPEDDVIETEGTDGEPQTKPTLPEPGTEIEVEIIELSSTGDGLARQPGSDRIYTVPFSVPGDTVKVKVFRHLEREEYSVADFISVVKPSPLRDDSRIQCPYFAKCAGCQFQMLDYPEQLRIKKTIVEKAYRNFSQLPPELVPSIQDTIGSPLQYNYRTKLTPHFDGPPGGTRKVKKSFEAVPTIGFNTKTSKKVLDIEDCPIGTPAVRLGLKRERERMKVEYGKYTGGATILLRENTVRIPKSGGSDTVAAPPEGECVKTETESYTDYKTCQTDNNATTTEYIDDFVFTNPAGSFFQNNNSILSPFTAYVREHILPPPSAQQKQVKYLIDAYSGSGLFTITLSPSLFPQGGTSIGIDIADKSIAFARRNAELNGLSQESCRFIAADANELFKSVGGYDPDETVVVLDPPRKGCDKGFLRQLLEFRPRRLVYVSCNVHTQARDVGVLVRGEVDGVGEEKEKDEVTGVLEDLVEKVEAVVEGVVKKEEKKKKVRYEIESIRGFDFFPQTGHVEGVAVLNRVDEPEASA
jgi:tRNA (uracil-5-)-methyltransferase